MPAESTHNHERQLATRRSLPRSNIVAQAGVKRMLIGDVSVALVPTRADGMVLTFIRNLVDHGYNLVDMLARKSFHMAVRATEDERLRAIVTNISRAAAHTIMESPAFASFAAQNAFRYSSATWLFYVDLPMTTSLRIGRYLRGRLMRLVDEADGDGDIGMGGLDDVESQKGATATTSSPPYPEAAAGATAAPQKNEKKRSRRQDQDDVEGADDDVLPPRKRTDVKAELVQDGRAGLVGAYSAMEEEEVGSETKVGSKGEVLYRCTGICNDGQKCKRWSKHAAGEPLVWHCSHKHKKQWETSVKILGDDTE